MSSNSSFLADCQRKIGELQKRVAETGSNVISRTQKWRRLSAVPSTFSDVVVTFRRGLKEVDVRWFVDLLHDRVPELSVQVRNHQTSGQYAVYLTASYRDLLIGAEELGLKKPLAPELGGGLREFSVEEMDLFENSNDEEHFFSSGERSLIVHHYLLTLCGRDGDHWNDTIQFSADQPMIRPLQSAGFIHQVFPVHRSNELKRFKTEWVQGWTCKQPLDDIRRYFGVQVALYFAWLGHYTSALLFPAVVGLLVWLFVDSKQYKFYHLIMAFLSLIWSTIYLEHWKRTSAMLTYHWGIWDSPSSLLEEPRTQFKGKLSQCPITGRMVRTYPSWRRNVVILFFTGPLIVLSLTVVICITFMFVRLQERMDPIAATRANVVVGLTISHSPKILLAVVIMLLDTGYRHLAIWLTNLENHRLESEYHSHLMGKLLLLQFMNSFYSLFYTAFYLQDMQLLQQQLSTLLITRQILGNLREVFLPYSKSHLRQFILSFRYERHRQDITHQRVETLDTKSVPNIIDADDSEHPTVRRRVVNSAEPVSSKEDDITISPEEREATLLPYDGTDDDFLEIFIQFGYVSMFSCVFPVAAALALINNLVEIRGDAFKLTTSFQRPFANPASSIGIWQVAMNAVGCAAVIVNIGLLSVSGTMLDLMPHLSATQSILLLVVMEHCVFVIHYMLSSLIADAPSSVVHQLAKLEYRRREALRTLERDALREYRRHRSSSRSQQRDNDN